ncbi:hypothetical protein LJR118_000588 [Acidovorax sp. LjRoot118]|uniref:hypothetical protein n=1 Tax=Acidovorax sp. LjRoot118 TaxID=3342256 RepID=UPI003ECDB027
MTIQTERVSVKTSGSVAKGARAASRLKAGLMHAKRSSKRNADGRMLVVGSGASESSDVASLKKAGKEVRSSRATALAFFQAAGILDADGQLAAPYRS